MAEGLGLIGNTQMASGIRDARFAVIGLLLGCAMSMSAHAATLTVTNTNDNGPGSLRQALASANNGDTINFAATGSIALNSGGLLVQRDVTISGPGTEQLAVYVDGYYLWPVFTVFPQKTVAISGLTITNAYAGIVNDQGTLTVSNCVVSDISRTGIYNSVEQGYGGASVTITNTVVSDSGFGMFNQSNTNQSGPNESPSFRPMRTMGPSGALIRKPADDRSGADNCTACMTIANSVVTRCGAWAVLNFTYGAATMSVLNSTLTGNYLVGIETYGYNANAEITVNNSTISGSSFYGGIYSGFSTVSIANVTISGNSAKIDGGGIYAAGGAVSIENSTISGNSAPSVFNGGGIYANGVENLSIVNSTISGNSAGTSGGGIYNYNSSLHIVNSTIAGNSAGSGGGIYNGFLGQVQVSNTVIDAGASGANMINDGGTISSLGYNLSSDDAGGYLNGPGDQINTDPLLGPLQDNHGLSFTHAPSPASPAIDAGDPGFTPPPSFDQRGLPFVRVVNHRIDIGSVEVQPRRPPPIPRSTPPR